MDPMLEGELVRLTANSAMRREDLLDSGLARSRRRKQLTTLAGILALSSAVTITAVVTKVFGADGMEAISALVALVSGTISLVVTAHYADDEIVGRLAGASKYLALRDSAFRIATDPDTTDKQKRKALAGLQSEYSNLDTTYSRYFTPRGPRSNLTVPMTYDSSQPPLFRGSQPPLFRGAGTRAEDRGWSAAAEDIDELHRNLKRASSNATSPVE
jgi:hypothetical protein